MNTQNDSQTEALRGLATVWDTLRDQLTGGLAGLTEQQAHDVLMTAASGLTDPHIPVDELGYLMVCLRGALSSLEMLGTGQMTVVDPRHEEARMEDYVAETLHRLTTGQPRPQLQAVAS